VFDPQTPTLFDFRTPQASGSRFVYLLPEDRHRAQGPLQILQPTWNGIFAHHPIPPGGATPPSRYNPHDAIYAAAYYLCDNGADHDIDAAVFAYNHSHQYVASTSPTCWPKPPANTPTRP